MISTMMHHPLLLASRPMRAMQQPRQPPLSTIWLMGAMPPRHQPLLSACQPMGAICRRKEMSWTLAPMATKWVPLAMAPRLPLAYLLCDNQLFFQFSDEDLRELGSCRQQLHGTKRDKHFRGGWRGNGDNCTGGPSPGCSECIGVRGRRCTHEQPVSCGRSCLNEYLSRRKGDGAGPTPSRSACNNVPGC